ncbi:MAG: RlpA-like double-psi beta-barrel domain-containing protein [Thermoleophilaceae bacterium]
MSSPSRAGRAAESSEHEASERERRRGEPSGESKAQPPSDEESAGEAREGSGPTALADRDSSALRDSIRREVRSATEGIGDSVRRDVGSRPERTGRRARDGGDPAPPSQGRRRGEAPRDGARDLGEGDEVRISASGGEPIDLDSRDNRQIYLGRTATVRGVVPSQRPGREVVLEAFSGGRWVKVDRDITDENGRFSMTWKPGYAGHRYVRVRRSNSTASTRPSRIRTLYVYRKRVASWYGPGFYGNRTACGQTFTSRLVGVAHRSLPCGYRVTIRYNDRYRTVRVVDRGPYVRGRHFDLTEALRNYLGFDGVDTVRATA